MAKGKGPRILGIYKLEYDNEDAPNSFHVLITLKQLRRLPKWVQSQLYWEYTGDIRHCAVLIEAKDELQAMMRFNKLWAGLPKED